MRRDLNRLSNESFDLLVVGGGIVGAAIARDATLRGLSVALVERTDFAHATSAHNSRLIHGGLRYLRNFEIGLVRESLQERQIWLAIAPHLVRPLPFLLPVASGRIGTRIALAAGLTLYDLLSLRRSRIIDPDQRLCAHVWLDPRSARALEPCLEPLPLAGAFRYFDAQMYSPERLALECVLDAADTGAVPVNHIEAETLLIRAGRVEGARVRDGETASAFDVHAQLTILALGPWTDRFLEDSLARPRLGLRLSKGIHVLVPPLTRSHALTLATRHGHFFVLPWRSATILGTTDTRFDGDPDTVGASRTEIEDFLRIVNAHLPLARLTCADVKHSYAGLRALVGDGERSTYDTSRRAELVDHGRRDGLGGLMTVIGGKWTTSRHLAQLTVDTIVQRLDRRAATCATASRPLPGGKIGRASDFIRESRAGAAGLPNPDHLAQLYGSRLRSILDIAAACPAMREPLSAAGDIGAQIVHAVHEEMALTLEDVIMRRTGIGQEGNPGPAALDKAAAIMAQECGWSESRRRAEIDAVAAMFRRTLV